MRQILKLASRFYRMTKHYGITYSIKRIGDSIYSRSVGRAQVRRAAVGVFAESSRAKRFEVIYDQNYWGNLESRSGTGSTREATIVFSKSFGEFLEVDQILSVFDAPCGDWNWMRYQKFPAEFNYLGGEIVPSLVDKLNKLYRKEGVNFIQHDITSDPFPETDAWLCRDCLFHLSYVDIMSVLENFARSKISVALITSHYATAVNRDIDTGDFRSLNLTKSPFFLKDPVKTLTESVGDDVRYVGVWSRSDISDSLPAIRELLKSGD